MRFRTEVGSCHSQTQNPAPTAHGALTSQEKRSPRRACRAHPVPSLAAPGLSIQGVRSLECGCSRPSCRPC